ncbi:MAG: FISUMP domain-containing protein [Paludibacter sp.]|nr:FISUMP domain-containing protein [Paludibacter sp.]
MKKSSITGTFLQFSILVFFISCEPAYDPELLPVLTTSEIIHLGPYSANSGGIISSDGGYSVKRRGVCWSSNPNPTINDKISIDGRGMGSFQSSITNLVEGETYFIRAYATNSIGTAYGQEIVFNTISHFNSDLLYGSVTDIDGNTYKTITIGSQTWMAENLRTTKYRNGHIIGYNDTINRKGKQWIYDDQMIRDLNTFGRLYTWYAVNDNRNIAPVGWRVPNMDDWSALKQFLINNGFNYDKSMIDNKIAKSVASMTIWGISSTVGAVGNDLDSNNNSGFSAVPGGYRSETGFFTNIFYTGYWWSSSEYNEGNAWYMYLGNKSTGFVSHGSLKGCGFAVRCILDN